MAHFFNTVFTARGQSRAGSQRQPRQLRPLSERHGGLTDSASSSTWLITIELCDQIT